MYGPAGNAMISMRKFSTVMGCAAASAVVATACTGPSIPTLNDPEEELRTGTLEVTTVTTGQNIDPNGYRISVDEERTETVDANGGALFSGLRAGPWQVTLADLAANCDLSVGMNPRVLNIVEDDTTPTSFIITCS